MSNLQDHIRRFDQFEVAVIGDLMMDRYIFGRATRISQEAPVPVVCVERLKTVPGGAANVARNLLSLSAAADVLGIVGQDHDGEELLALLKDAGADTGGTATVGNRRTTVKTRVIAANQQVVRIDFEDTDTVPEACQRQILDNLKKRLETGHLHAIILEDYAKGMFTETFMRDITVLAAQYHVPVTLDPHSTHPFDVKGIRLMTPNRQEAFALAGIPFVRGVGNPLVDQPLLEVGKILKERWRNELLLITLGGEGMALFEGDNPVPLHIPTQARQVFDVSGAGDTVMATMTLALLAGATPGDAARIANSAAGVVVGLVGTAAIQKDALLAQLS